MNLNFRFPSSEEILSDRETLWKTAVEVSKDAGGAVVLGLNFPYRAFAAAGGDGFAKAAGLAEEIVSFYSHFVSETVLGMPSSEGGIPGSPWRVWAWRRDPLEAKTICLALEGLLPGGRILDLDSYDFAGLPISRNRLGLAPRPCFICPDSANLCRFSDSHPAEEVIRTFSDFCESITRAFPEAFDVPSMPGEPGAIALSGAMKFDATLTGHAIAAMGSASMAEELFLTPKPGLVDAGRFSAHSDMDLPCLARSVAAVCPHLESAWKLGREWDGPLQGKIVSGEGDPGSEGLLRFITPAGMKADGAMLKASGGVNTHRGVVFALGIGIAALGRASRAGEGGAMTISSFRELIIRLFEADLEADLRGEAWNGDLRATAFQGRGRARDEAAKGFPQAENAARIISRARFSGWDRRSGLLLALFDSMSRLEDSNILNRSGRTGLAEARTAGSTGVGFFPDDPAGLLNYSEGLDRDWSGRGLSPGGSADVLIMGIWLDRLVSAGILTLDDPDGVTDGIRPSSLGFSDHIG